jgi:uncharacterized protein YegP (UPF0339 family)
MPNKKIHKPFVIKKDVNGQHFVETVGRNRKIGFVSESFLRRQGADRAVKSLIKYVYEAITLIDGDMSRIGELIDDKSVNK